ncbi:MAG: SDR family oxidoreductase [Leptospiraceae bacterium]|nr:SDR family oxidoreductase [Leptospiraceae bacterium]
MELKNQKTSIVTGGAGFLGSHICLRLLDRGQHVVCVDNFHTGRFDNIRELLLNPDFELVRHDIIEPLYMDADYIYNMACPASPPHYQANPVRTFKTSALGTMNMLGLAKRCKGRLLQASTSEIYGDPQHHPQKESYWGNVNPCGIRSCYDEGKRAAETLCFDYHRVHQVDIRVIRIFNTYGPNMDPVDGRVVSNFILQALQNQDITVYGDGQQTRSFCYVSDLVRGIIDFMHNEKTIGPMNLGNDGEFTMLELAELVIEMTGSKSRIVHQPLPADDPTRRRPDLSLARSVIGFEPRVPLRSGLEQTIAYYKGLLASA